MMNKKDYSLESGERQTAVSFAANRADHKLRYELALDYLRERRGVMRRGADVFCGTGFGSWFLADSGFEVFGFEGSEEAVEFAKEHYSTKSVRYCRAMFPFTLLPDQFDFVICFESLEHVHEDGDLLEGLVASLRQGGLLFLSAPNEAIMPFDVFANCYPFHFRHYSLKDLSQLASLRAPRLRLLSWYGQDTYRLESDPLRRNGLLSDEEMCLRKAYEGQTLVSVYEKI